MSNILGQTPPSDMNVNALREAFVAPSRAGACASISNADELPAADTLTWDALRLTFQMDWRRLDPLLLKLHYRRERIVDPEQRRRVQHFLVMAYANSRDVRYLNEYLWFRGNGATDLDALAYTLFAENVDAAGIHVFPLATPEAVRQRIVAINAEVDSAPKREVPCTFRIGLLGTPSAFTRLHRTLAEAGHHPRIYFFTYEPKAWKRFVKSTPALARAAFMIKGCRLPYTTIAKDYRDKSIGDDLAAEGLDVGIQRIGFIVKNHIIEPFRMGLFNGHMAVLPFIRGRSSVEFSMIHGFPVGATVHFVDEGVDTGEIVRVFAHEVPEFAGSTLDELKRVITARTDQWFAETIRFLSERQVSPQPNPWEEGLQYYTMHPELGAFVERHGPRG
ncbi:MAG TPA: formyltransferase family protein [Candidatus Hydrogenedentes bacterium]|nr:formyltransferase family protein [Candidatus Hydrogenedentota bacterium]HPG69041.1 formyltransferase family protein [Candidatus Hydrogenedentota bacterium]